MRGSYRDRKTRRRIQTFRCSHCDRSFSHRTFSPTYWLRYPHLLRQIAALICEGAGLRQIARLLNISHTTVARYVARLARHCLLFHRRLLRGSTLREAIVADGFESFAYSQYFPFHANLAVGAESWFLYHFTDSPLRRKGTMTAAQRKRRTELEKRYGRADPQAVEKGMAALLKTVVALLPEGQGLKLDTDDHPAYRRALRRLRRAIGRRLMIEHRVTSSTVRRTQSNPLFPVNLADLLLRHANANHRRETIAFSKLLQAVMERLAVFTVWRNCIKQRSENGPRETAAMRVGLTDRMLRWREVLRRRLFPGHADLPAEWSDYYWGRVKSAIYGERQRVHQCQYAF